MNDLTERYFIVLIRIDNLQKITYLALAITDIHAHDQIPELRLVQNAVAIRIDLLKDGSELIKELLMLLQLEIQHSLHEFMKQHLARILRRQQRQLLLPRDPILRMMRPQRPPLRKPILRPLPHNLMEHILQHQAVLLIIHPLDNLRPVPVLNETLLDRLAHLDHIHLALMHIFLPQGHLEQIP